MDRINIQCLVSGQDTSLQLDKKSMPGGAGPCFMITANGCFQGYISRQKNGCYKFSGTPYYSSQDLLLIWEQLSKSV
jgi:hypothetical protein